MTAATRLVDRLGIATAYVDHSGDERTPPQATIDALVRTLHAAAAPVDDLADPVTILSAEDDRHRVLLHPRQATGDTRIDWTIETESGDRRSETVAWAHLPAAPEKEAGPVRKRYLPLPRALPAGYHRLTVADADSASPAPTVARLVVAPSRAYLPPALESGGAWGIAIQLYALRSPRNWGIGDLTDLARFAKLASAHGAGTIGINPLHALFLDEPERASPYSPNSRLCINPLYLDVEAIAEFAICPAARERVASAAFSERLAALRARPLVDYAAVAALKCEILPLLHTAFRQRRAAGQAGVRAQEFDRFRSERGPALRNFAIFEALREHLSADNPSLRDWRRWPAALQDPASPATAAFAGTHAERVEFFEYLQWQCEVQLEYAQATARAGGMAIGLYHDLAVGSDGGGADAWSDPGLWLSGWEVGAPPDKFHPLGQRWGLPPLNPVALETRAYEPFLRMLRATMRHAGAIRIDHALGLARLFVIPGGATAAAGTFLRMPLAGLLAMIRLESRRHACLVVGEDLGTLPDGLQDELGASGLFSTRLFMFERAPDGAFHDARGYPRNALAAFSTHDLPTLAGYWTAADIALRVELGLIGDPGEAERQRGERMQDKHRMCAHLRRMGCADEADAGGPPLRGIHRFLARTPARLVMVQIEDALGMTLPANLPGTHLEYPNWRRKLPVAIDQVFADPGVAGVFAAIAAERRGRPAA